jgi:hypothetical protein
MTRPPSPPPLEIRGPITLHARAREYHSEAAPVKVRLAECPDDGEPNPAAPGFVDVGRAPCGRPEPCDKGDCASCRAAGGRGHPEYLALVNELKRLHLTKSGGYGTGSDPFANFSAVAQASGEPRYLYAILRSLEKLTRCLSLHAQGRVDELGEEFTDTASLLLCAEAMRRDDSAGD